MYYLLVCLFLFTSHVKAITPDQELRGQVTSDAHQSYQYINFNVPENTTELVIEFNYQRDNHTVIDLGLKDPQRFRGWSGGSKQRLVISDSYATSGYLPGSVVAGQWQLVLGVPNIRPSISSDYHVKLYYNERATEFSNTNLNSEAGWYRGDLHAHTGHSDGHCQSFMNKKIACPLFLSVQQAANRGIDFLALTEHNTLSQHNELIALQPYFDNLLLMTGREITTFYGHINIFGVPEHIPFEVTDGDIRSLQQEVIDKGGIIIINHPALPSGEACMGCGWTATTDYNLIAGIEVINGSVMRDHGERFSARAFWHKLLDQGYKLAAVAGSDNHNGQIELHKAGDIGRPSTFIYGSALQNDALLTGIKMGKTFIAMQPDSDRIPKLTASSAGETIGLGETLVVKSDSTVQVRLELENSTDYEVNFYAGKTKVTTPIKNGVAVLTLPAEELTWLTAEIVDEQKQLLYLTSPLYFKR